jgi:hypothetical protein
MGQACGSQSAAETPQQSPGAQIPKPATERKPALRSQRPSGQREDGKQLAFQNPILSPELAKKSEAATRIQAVIRKHQTRPAAVSLRVAATQSWRHLPRDREGKVFPIFSSSLVPLSYAEGVGNMLALRFELEFGLVFAIIFGMHYLALKHNLAGDAITSRPLEIPFPGAAGSLGNATSLESVHGMGDALSSILLALAIIGLRRVYRAWQQNVDDHLVTVADYAVVLSGLPPNATSGELTEWIRKTFFAVQLVGVTLVLDEAEILRLMRQLSTLRRKDKDLLRSMLRTKSRLAMGRHDELRAEIETLEKQLRLLRSMPQPCVGMAFAVFNRMNDSQQVVDEAHRHPYVDGSKLKADRAPEPSDVLWENLHLTRVQQASRRTLGLLLSLVVTSLATIIMGIARCARCAARLSAHACAAGGVHAHGPGRGAYLSLSSRARACPPAYALCRGALASLPPLASAASSSPCTATRSTRQPLASSRRCAS